MDNQTMRTVIKNLMQIRFMNMDKAIDILLSKIDNAHTLEEIIQEVLNLDGETIRGL